MDKQSRQAALLAVVRDRAPSNQAEIVQYLVESGVHATQASVSRDIRELGLLKIKGRYASRAAAEAAQENPDESPIAELVTAIEPVGANLVVVRTSTGGASSVAVALDELELADVVGTIAGDDTIFVAVRSRAALGRVMTALRPWVALKARDAAANLEEVTR